MKTLPQQYNEYLGEINKNRHVENADYQSGSYEGRKIGIYLKSISYTLDNTEKYVTVKNFRDLKRVFKLLDQIAKIQRKN